MECFSSGSYLYQKHLLYRGTTNNEVTSEQNINSTAADPHGRQILIKRSAEENMEYPRAFSTTSESFCKNMCFGHERNAGKGGKMRR